MGIINTETFINDNGEEMRKDTYANGMIITQAANVHEPEPEPQTLSEQEQIAIDTALTVEYMACLMETNLG